MEKEVAELKPNPTQKAFIVSRADADLFSARMGEGKSTAIAWACYYHTKHNPGAVWAIIRDTWDNLEASTMQEFFRWFPAGVYGKYIPSRKCFVWNPPLNGKVYFVPADSPSDALRLQSRMLGGVGIDEVAPVGTTGGISETLFDIAFGRLRQPGMNWYACKLACNNPDRNHWVYKRFVDPGEPGFVVHQTKEPENLKNLPEGYYEKLKAHWGHRKDLIARFVEGQFAAVYEGDPVISCWSNELIEKEYELDLSRKIYLFWDGGTHPACLVAQKDISNILHITHEFIGSGIGAYEMIHRYVRPFLVNIAEKYGKSEGFWSSLFEKKSTIYLEHIGDPTMRAKEQSRAYNMDVPNSAAQVIVDQLGGVFRAGAPGIDERLEPLRILCYGKRIAIHERCVNLISALDGAWYYRQSGVPEKNHPYSDLGDALAYGVSVLYPAQARINAHYRFQQQRYFYRPDKVRTWL